MACIFPHIIFHKQSVITKTRGLANSLLAQEMIHKLDSNRKGRNVIFKLDLAKAYDRIPWLFILKVLRKFGFGEQFNELIWSLIYNYCYFVLVNGKLGDFFKSTRGVR